MGSCFNNPGENLHKTITSKKGKGDKGSPCCNPLEVKKKLVGKPFIRIVKEVEEMQ